MMKKILLTALLAAVAPWYASAQVEKRVEVTKAYVPSLEQASKLPLVPDMTDTTRMRPEIDYAIEPLSLRTSLETRPIRPAKVTYWEFNRPSPLYLKIGAGYPLNSVFDLYASSQNPGTGYVVGYVNHEGRFADIANDYGVENNSVRMTNRVGAAAGKYFGRRTLEGELSYENRMYHRSGAWFEATDAAAWRDVVRPGGRIDYGDAQVALRFGDDFKELSRINFEISAHGGLFFDHSEAYGYGNPARQTTLGAAARLARGFGRHRLSVGAGYERLAGQKSIADYTEQLIRAGVRYGLDGGTVRMELGADYWYDKTDGTKGRSYVVPFARFEFDLGTPGLRPFVEIDGGVRENSFRSLVRQNPYMAAPTEVDWAALNGAGRRSSVDYAGRFGLRGSLWRSKADYTVYGAFTVHDSHIYWLLRRTTVTEEGAPVAEIDWGAFWPVAGRQTETSINGEMEFRPVAALRMSLGVHGYFYNDEVRYGNGAPAFRGDFAIRYEGRKVAFGVGVGLQSSRSWTLYRVDAPDGVPTKAGTVEVPFGADLRARLDWMVSRRVALFAEGRNLANRPLYEFAGYREYGAHFTAGVKLNF